MQAPDRYSGHRHKDPSFPGVHHPSQPGGVYCLRGGHRELSRLGKQAIVILSNTSCDRARYGVLKDHKGKSSLS